MFKVRKCNEYLKIKIAIASNEERGLQIISKQFHLTFPTVQNCIKKFRSLKKDLERR